MPHAGHNSLPIAIGAHSQLCGGKREPPKGSEIKDTTEARNQWWPAIDGLMRMAFIQSR